MNPAIAPLFAATLSGIAVLFPLAAGGEDNPDAAPKSAQQATTPSPVDPRSTVVNDVLQIEARKQAAGLGQGRVVVNGAWNYTGYSTLTPHPEARLVAVDITILNYTDAFDYDDIEIVDAVLRVSYGSDPYIALLNSAGKLEKDPEKLARAPGPTRLLLVYGFPKSSKTFHLVYWGKKLNLQPVKYAERGWEVPFPSTPAKASAPSPPVAPTPAPKAEPAARGN